MARHQVVTVILQHELRVCGAVGCGYPDDQEQGCELSVITPEDEGTETWRYRFVVRQIGSRIGKRLKIEIEIHISYSKARQYSPNPPWHLASRTDQR